MIGLFYAYLVRFLALAWGAIEASLLRIPRQLDDAARGLGADRLDVIARVHVPLLRTGLITAALLVFVEVMKELPATLLLRPLGRRHARHSGVAGHHRVALPDGCAACAPDRAGGPAAGGADDQAVRAYGAGELEASPAASAWADEREACAGMSHVLVRGLSKSFGAIEAVAELTWRSSAAS